MLSDEEKTALEFIKINNEHKYCGKDDVDFLLNLIEKQSKEIEGLIKVFKECIEEKFNNDKKWEDKIKAKIENYERLSNNITIQPQIYPYIIEVLQSLLEKE